MLFSLESPHGGDSNEYTQYTIFNMKKKISLNYPKSATMRFFPRDSRTESEFETVEVNEPTVFEPLRVYCTSLSWHPRAVRRVVCYWWSRKGNEIGNDQEVIRSMASQVHNNLANQGL